MSEYIFGKRSGAFGICLVIVSLKTKEVTIACLHDTNYNTYFTISSVNVVSSETAVTYQFIRLTVSLLGSLR